MKSNSFVIQIKDTQNESWQGTIEWVEGQRKENFRSALEMIKLVDSAVNNHQEGVPLYDGIEKDKVVMSR